MRRVLGAGLLLLLAGILAAVAWAQDNRVLAPGSFDLNRGNVERGRAVAVGVFAATAPEGQRQIGPPGGACFRCHGLDGKGDGIAVFPRLTGQVEKYLYESLRDYASGVRQNPVMTPIAEALTDQEMRDVSAYYAAQNAPYEPKPAAVAHLLQRGGMLAAIGSAERGIQGCVNCHGPDGVGLPPIYPFLAGQHATYIDAQLRAWQTGVRKGDRLAIMEMIAKRMTDRDIRAVAAYYASLRPRSVTPQAHDGTARIHPLPSAIAPELGRIGRQ